MLDYVIKQTMSFLENMPKSKRKKKGQFFTSAETAMFMADMFDLSDCEGSVSVLDPGAGTGILSIAFLERLMSLSSDINASLTCYETDPEVLPVLKSNLEYAKSEYPGRIEYRVLEEDYILSQSNDFEENLLANEDPLKYDYIIANPPYLRVMRDHPAAMSMPKVVHGAPNLYFLFAAMSLFNLKNEAEMVYIIPRSWTSGAYFKAFREYLSKFDGQAVTIEDFLECFESSSGVDLTQFRRWYTQAGTPNIDADWTYDKAKSKLVVTMTQSTAPTKDQEKKEPFYIPVRLSFLLPDGSDIKPLELPEEGFVILDTKQKEFEFTVPEGTLPVLLRDFSAPVKLKAPYSIENYQHMMSYCDDAFIKVDSAVSMQNMYIHEHVNEENEDCFKDPSQLIESYRTLLNNAVNSGDLLLINETLTIQSMQNMMETFDTIDIDGLSRARNVLEKKLAINLYKEYQDVYEKIKASKAAYSVDDMAKRAISNNALHMMALSLVSEGKSDAASALVLKHFNRSKNMTDRLQAMKDAVHLDLRCKDSILKEFEKEWSDDALVFDNFFRVQATVPSAKAIDNVKSLLSHKSFDGNNPNRVRALVGALSLSNPVALHQINGDGYELLCREVARLNNVNPSVAARILTPLLSFRRFDKKRQEIIKEKLSSLMNINDLSRSIYEKVSSALAEA